MNAKGGDDPTQPFINVDGVEPMLTNPWRSQDSPGLAGPVDLSLPWEGGPATTGDTLILGDSPSNPQGVNQTIHFGANSIYEHNAESPVVKDSRSPSPLRYSRTYAFLDMEHRHLRQPLLKPWGGAGHRTHGPASTCAPHRETRGETPTAPREPAQWRSADLREVEGHRGCPLVETKRGYRGTRIHKLFHIGEAPH